MQLESVEHNVSGTTFKIPSKYVDLKPIGKGSYGVVVSALNSVKNLRVAIKKITPMAKHTLDAKHILREVRIMRYMGRHENIITLEDIHVYEQSDELYIVMELMDSDLHRVLQSKQILTEAHFRHFLFQILCGLKFLHDNRIIHRDLKPGNLLVTRDCRLRISDFGLAREMPSAGAAGPDLEDDIIEPMTEHVVTRWYRPPELMLCPDGLYSFAVDLWSVGCIFAEMLGRRPLFPGKNFVHQLTLIFDVIGTPLRPQISHIKNSQAKKFLDSQVGKNAVQLTQIFPQASAESLDLLERLLRFDPEERIDASAALQVPFLNELYSSESPSLRFPACDERCEFEFERNGSSKYQLKKLIIDEALSFKQDNGIDSSAHTPKLAKAPVDLNANDTVTRGSAPKTQEHSGARAMNPGRALSGAPRRPVSAISGRVLSSGYGQMTRQRSSNLRPASASATAVQTASSGRISHPAHDEAEKALAAARAWLSAAAAASDTGVIAPIPRSTAVNRNRVSKMSSAAASGKAMQVLQSPTRHQQERFKGSPKRYGVSQQRARSDLDPRVPSRSLLEDAATFSARPTVLASNTTTVRPRSQGIMK